ncbi:MAG TPA: hypothetical protein VFA20_28785 [Myxococcaceae bacterium]|nr:hypothetical protein [Myxococcaceae bacterium]
MAPPARDFGAIQGASPVRFTPATSAPYECTIHTLQMKGSDGRTYNVVLDLIRSDENPLWGVSQDRTALRAVVSDAATGEVVASRFVDAPREEFQEKVGDLGIMDGQGGISFAAADGQMAFDLGVKIEPSTLVQTAGDTLKEQVEKAVSKLPPDQRRQVMERFPLQLLVTDYPKTRHTGTMTVQVPGRGEPLTLTADDTPSTVSHHFGNSLTDYVFLASVPKEHEPSFIAVVTREQVDLDPSKPGGEASIPFGYLIRTDAQGRSTFSFLTPDADRGGRPGEFDLGSDLLGTAIDVKVKHEAGQVVLNDGHLPTRTGFGEATIEDSRLLSELGLGKEQHFSDVVVDITGRFLDETGRKAP